MNYYLLSFTKNYSLNILKQQNRSLVGFKDIFGKKKGSRKDDKIDEFIEGTVSESKKIDSEFSSLKDRSVTRLVHRKAYKPTADVENIIKEICKNTYMQQYNEENYLNLRFDDRIIKFTVLNECISKFKHNIPNTTLNDITTVADLINYYKTQINDTNALEDLKQRNDLPKNLHINLETTRFDPKTDNFFNKMDAFPDRDTYSSSLWYSKKYKPIKKEKELFKK